MLFVRKLGVPERLTLGATAGFTECFCMPRLERRTIGFAYDAFHGVTDSGV